MTIFNKLCDIRVAGVIFALLATLAIGWAVQMTMMKDATWELAMSDILTSLYEDKPLTVLEKGVVAGPDIYYACGYINNHLKRHPEQKDVLVSKSVIVRRCVK